jgi:hypothetical protein
MCPAWRGEPAIEMAGGILNVGATLREEANVLRKWGAGPIADVLDRCRETYEEALREYQKQLVNLAEAALHSGYSKDHLRRMARSGRGSHDRLDAAPPSPGAPWPAAILSLSSGYAMQ